MTIRDDLAQLCALEAKFKALTAERDWLKRKVLDHALNVYETDGMKPTWRAGDVTVSLVAPTPKPSVVDEDAFADYVADAYGEDKLVTIRRVPDGDLRASLLASIQDDNPDAGVMMKANAPSIRLEVSKEAKAAAAVGLTDEIAADAQLLTVDTQENTAWDKLVARIEANRADPSRMVRRKGRRQSDGSEIPS